MKKKILILFFAVLSTGLFQAQKANAVVGLITTLRYNWVPSSTHPTEIVIDGKQYIMTEYFSKCEKSEDRDRCWWFQANGNEYSRGYTLKVKTTLTN